MTTHDTRLGGPTTGPPATDQPAGMFTRKATGLVREIGTLDAFLLNLFWINLFVGILIFTQAPAIFPGVTQGWGFLLTTVVLIAPTLVYAFLASAMPRAGGDYVYISRIIHPAVGFFFSFAFSLMLTLYICIFAALLTVQCIGTFFATVGTVAESPTLLNWAVDVSGKGWTYGIGAAAIVLVCVLNLFGLRPLMAIVRIFFVLSMLGIVISGILLATTSRTEFAEKFAKYGSYDGVITAAANEGFTPGTGNSFGTMMSFLALGFTFLALSQFPAYAAGELRRPRRSTLVAMLGGLAFTGGLFALLAAGAGRTFGGDFLGSMTTLALNGSDQYPAGLPAPFYFLYTGLLTDSITLNVLMSLGIILGFLGAIAMLVTVVSRNLLAYSLDNLMPAWIRRTDARRHSPRNAIIAIGVVATLVYIPYVYGPPNYFTFVFSGIILIAIVLTMTMISAIIFPWRRKAIFESSPYNQRVLGIPLISILGFVSAGLYAWWCYEMITDDRIGANSDVGLRAVGIIFGIALAWYLGAWWLNKRRGVDLNLRYQELPPE